MLKWETDPEIQTFREYLQIPSVHPNVDYEPCVEFLKKQAEILELPINVSYPGNEKCPVIVMTWEGARPNIPSIMVNSHMDVAPVDEPRWTHPPFGAEIDGDGNIYARGAQHMKCCGTQYLGAIRALKQQGVKLQRTIHVTFVPDKENGGEFGMKAFVKNPDFKSMNVGFAMDGSCAAEDHESLVFYAERTHYIVEVICKGQAAHECILLENTAGDKLYYMLDQFARLREQEVEKLKMDSKLTLGDVTTVNLTLIKGGVKPNVVPAELGFTVDIFLAIDVDPDDFEKQIEQWCMEAGGGVTLKYHSKDPKIPATKTDDENLFWIAFEDAVKQSNLSVRKIVCPENTDARYIRELNIPALGFTPMPNTPDKHYDHDEFLNADVYSNGIKIYEEIITSLGNVPGPVEPEPPKKSLKTTKKKSK